MEFEPQTERQTQILTTIAVLFLVVLYFVVMIREEITPAGRSVYLAFVVLIIGVPYLFAPRRFIVDTNGIEIKRLIGSVMISWDSVREVRLYRKLSITRDIRNFFGSQGLYGYFGLYLLKGEGKVHAYLTSLTDCVLVVAEKKKYLLSPYPTDEFLRTVNSISGINYTEN